MKILYSPITDQPEWSCFYVIIMISKFSKEIDTGTQIVFS